MNKAFERYQKYYQNKGGNHEIIVTNVTVEQVDDSLYQDQSSARAAPPITPPSSDAAQMIRQILEQESHLRNQREKYRMNYYKLEAAKADQEEFAHNYAVIKSLTDQLAPLYLQRKRIEQTGEVEHKKVITQDQENEIRSLKYDKKRMIDKRHKLQKKIAGFAGFAKGEQNRPKWESELELINLSIYEIDEQIKKIEE